MEKHKDDWVNTFRNYDKFIEQIDPEFIKMQKELKDTFYWGFMTFTSTIKNEYWPYYKRDNWEKIKKRA